MKKLRKALIVSVMFMTVISMSVIAAPNVNAAASAGDLIKMDGLSSVYYLAADGKRYVFPNETTYFSWYEDFSSVVTIPQSELESYPLGANVTVRPGTKLVKITTNPKVYAVEPGGSLVGIASEAAAQTLYGSDWASRVVDVPDAFFTNYTVSSSELDGTAYPTGSLIKTANSADIYYIDATGNARKIVDEAAMSANRFRNEFVITTTLAIPALGADIIGAESALIDTSSGAGGTAGAGTGLTVSLAANTPASATVIINNTSTTGNGQAMVPFTTINFTAASDGDVRVDTVRVKRTGISTDSDVENLYLFDGDTRLTDASSVSSGYATFNNAVSGLFTVLAGQTKTITVKGDILYSATSGKTIGFSVESASDVVTDGASVSGTFPVSGNPMSTAVATDLGKLTFSSANTPGAANTSVDPGTNDQELWKVTLVGANQELAVEKLVFTAVGSIQKDDLDNFKLYQGGTLLGEAASLNDNNEVVIDMSANPFIIPKGASRVISLRGDIIKGSTRTVYFSFQNSADVVVKDTNYGVYVQPYTAGNWSVVMPGNSANWLIASGSLSVSKSSNSPTEDVVVDGTNVVLGEWDFKASGENIKIKNLNVKATISTYGGIDNGKVYVDGTQVGTTKDLTQGTPVNFTFGSTFIVAAGTTAKVQVVGDVKTATSTSFSGGETVAVQISQGSGNAQRVSSLGTFNAPSSAVAANTLNITAAALTISKFSGYGNQTIVAGTNNAKVGSFVLQAGAAEGVDVGSITVTLSSDEQATVTNMILKDHADGTQLGAEKVNPSTSNIYSVNGLSVPASGSKVIDVYANVISGSDSGPWIAQISSEGSGIVTGNAVSATATNVQTITIGSGALYANNGSNADAAIVIAGSTGNASTQVTFSASNEGYTISQLLLKTEANFASNTAQVTISYKDKNGTTQTASAPFISSSAQTYATATFTGLTMYVPKGGDSNLNTSVDTVLLSENGASGNNGKIYLDYNNGFKATGDSGSTKASVGTADISGNSMYVRKSKPTFAKQSISTTPSSSSDLFKFSVVADGAGNIEIKQLSFNFSTSGATVLGAYLYDPNTSTVITDTAVNPDSSGDVKLIVGAVDNDVLTIGTTAKTYSVRGTVAGWGDTGDTMTVKFKQDTSVGSTASSESIRGSVNNVWSDRSAANHSTTSADWTSAYLLKNMTNAQSF